MDGTTRTLEEELYQLLRDVAEVSVALKRVEGIVGFPTARLSRPEPMS
jgi:hypothetical protein